MKLTILLLLTCVLHSIANNTYSQSAKVTLNLKNAKVEEVLNEIEKKSEYYFLLNQKQVDINRRVDIVMENSPIKDVLANLFKGEEINFVVYDRQIILTPKEKTFLTEIQQQKITGQVTDATNGDPIIGANIVVEGTNIGVISDMEGKFSIAIATKEAVLVFSYIGYNTEKVTVSGQTNIEVKMVPDITKLDEIVVVGYGSQKKRDIIGSVSTVDMTEMKAKSTGTIDAGLQGMAAGVSVMSQSGTPGAPTVIKIRGTGSITSNTDPLWIVDGMPITGPMFFVNSNDIESMQVLKDAAATSIYGSRASNGVIIVTTKSGKKGEGTTSFNFSSGVSTLTRTPEDIGYVNTQEWFQLMDATYQNSEKRNFTMDDYYRYSPNATTKITREQAMATNTNWYDELFRYGTFQDYNLSSSKAFEKGAYFISANYRKDNGVQRFNDMDRYSVRSNLDFSPTKNISLGVKLNLSSSNNNKIPSGITSLVYGALPWMPVFDPINPNNYFNAYADNPAAVRNPVNYLDNTKIYRGLVGLSVDYKLPFINGMSLRGEFSADLAQKNDVNWQSAYIRKSGVDPSSYSSEATTTSQTVNYNLYGTYNKTIGTHNLSLVGGTEVTRINAYYRFMSGQNLNGKYQQLGSPSEMLRMVGEYGGENFFLGYFFRANYKLNDKYMLGFSGRQDGSSIFTKENRWGTFYAASAGWVISEENFMQSIVGDKVSLKLRGSYGEVGNSSIPRGLDAQLYTNNNTSYGSPDILGVNGTSPINIANKNLKWETTKSTDFGIDFGFLKNKINGSLAYYHRLVTDMLLYQPLPVSTGITSSNTGANAVAYDFAANKIMTNIGDMVNSGIELEIHSVNINKGKFRWSTDFNISFNKNIIKKINPDADATGKGYQDPDYWVSRKGQVRREWYIADYAGVDRATGLPYIYAVDKAKYDKTGETERIKNIQGKDSTVYATTTNILANPFHQTGKSIDPKYYGGITNNFQYGDFDFSFMFSFSGGNYILDYDRQMATTPGETRVVLKELYDNSWKKIGDAAKYPKLVARGSYLGVGTGFDASFSHHNRELYKGDYIRLRNVEFGYNLKRTWVQKLKLQSLRINVSASNLFTITQYPGFDPEGAELVMYSSAIPQLKSVMVGIDLKF